MDGSRIVVACATLRGELELAMKRLDCDYPVAWLDSGLHCYPQRLRVRLQELLDGLPEQYDTVLLAMGFCGNSLVGIESRNRRLVLPAVPDCIPLFLGSNDAREQMGSGTYFFTEGYLRCEHTILTEYTYYCRRYGPERGKKYSKALMAHYQRLAVVDTGAFEPEPIAEEIGGFAALLDIPVSVVPGDLGILERLLRGQWMRDGFLEVPPGGAIMFSDTLNTGKSQVLTK